jgi:transposase
MKSNKQSKKQMQAAADSVDTGASQGARRATQYAPVSTRPLSPSIDSEVLAIAKRRSRTNVDKRRIVLAAATCAKPGEIGTLMRRVGV